MNAAQRADVWEEVWADYDARQAERGPERVAEAAAPAPVRARGRRARPVLQVVLGLVGGLAMLGLWLLLPWLLAMRLSVPLGQGDAPGLLRQFDMPVAMASLREGLRAEVPEEGGAGARRFLSGMADRMADSWERPEAVSAWLSLRARGGRGEGSPVVLSNLRAARPLGLAAFRLEYGPRDGAGGVSFDLAWGGDGFKVTAMRFLDAPATASGGMLVAVR